MHCAYFMNRTVSLCQIYNTDKFLIYDCAEDTSLADNAIQYALMMFPGVLKPLLDELSVQVDSRVSTHTYFNGNAYNR